MLTAAALVPPTAAVVSAVNAAAAAAAGAAASATTTTTTTTTTAVGKPRRRKRFFVELGDTESFEINFKALVQQQLARDTPRRLAGNEQADGDEDNPREESGNPQPQQNQWIRKEQKSALDKTSHKLSKLPRTDPQEEEEGDDQDPSQPSTPTASALVSTASSADQKAAKASRFNIIERLEKRYGGGPVLDLSATAETEMEDEDLDNRHEDDDLYDSEDSFIDDSELSMNIEEIHGQKKVKTKHSGFFVNAGEEIETVVNEEERETKELRPVEPMRKNKRAKKASGETSKAVKAFLDEWSDAASDWKPSAVVIASIEALKAEVEELSKTSPIKKVFPRKLDDALRNVDKLVVDSHPNKWRVNGYFATLMKFLPFTKPYLKTNMLRLEARDVARDAKNTVELAVDAFSKKIAGYSTQTAEKTVEQLKAEILQDRSIATSLHSMLALQDEWVAKENEHRQLLKTEDKKHLDEREYIILNARQERNRLFNRLLALFPSGLMDMPSLRGLNRSVKKIKTPRQSPQLKASSTSATSTTGVKAPSSSGNTPPNRKRVSRPLKSRQVEDCPVFYDQDFQEKIGGGDGNGDDGGNNAEPTPVGSVSNISAGPHAM